MPIELGGRTIGKPVGIRRYVPDKSSLNQVNLTDLDSPMSPGFRVAWPLTTAGREGPFSVTT